MDLRQDPTLLGLPTELILQVLSYLSLRDLLSVGRVNKFLSEQAMDDSLYRPLVQEHVPGTDLDAPKDSTWRELYIRHHPYWFIPKHKLWFADTANTGKLIIARYNHRIDAIEAYALVAERRQPTFLIWDYKPDVIIHTFSPRIQLDLNVPIMRLDKYAYENATGGEGYRLRKEVPMNLFQNDGRPVPGLYSRLMLSLPWPKRITSFGTPVWPPFTLPGSTRVRTDSPSGFRGPSHQPERLSQLSTTTFRTRRWLEFASRQNGIRLTHGAPGMPDIAQVNVRVGEEVSTWATLPEEAYTPTPDKPFRGIFCGDYAGHGCEFLAVLQPDEPQPLPYKAEITMSIRERLDSMSSTESWSPPPAGSEAEGGANPETNALDTVVSDLEVSAADETTRAELAATPQDESIYHGRIEAVKLTGDPNVPRGEYTFIAPDIGPSGLVRVATEEMFRGARVVKSLGHIAARGFHDDGYMASQLIIISPNRLAQYWETFGHVSFYERVDIDQFTKVP
ncbi:hypothetical protein M011DRAFT_494258 [Sporormia fimetaria CBS 119925]|uniref:F-box domain-containing protein n=1 Tax=Sporormia fimetaria CBS 119925 TaxID=1340428 RepID=A0A6A6VA81_9PLEO|nr:hypothetical protein M011DRAFT_494258 [Sporormia fimetaria CBS 119925]